MENELPDWQVRVLDLNHEAHEAFLDHLGPPARPPALEFDRPNLRFAKEVLQGRHPEDFYDRARYLHYAQVWARAMPGFLDFEKQLKERLEGGRMPRVLRRQLRLILREKPDAVGISVLYAHQRMPALGLAAEIKRRLNVPIILGGTVFNDVVPSDLDIRRAAVDYIVVGGGERPLVDILAGRAAEQVVPGVLRTWCDHAASAPQEPSPDLDWAGEPDFSDLNLDSYYSPAPVLPVQATRGCYWRRCAFCSHYRSAGQVWQRRSAEAVVRELAGHVERGVRFFYFTDSSISPQVFSRLADAIIQANLEIRYYAMARLEPGFDEELLGRMRRSGCTYLLWGLESGCQRILDLMDKGTRVYEAERVLRRTARAGIRNHVFTICGFPTETREEYQQTLDFLERNRPWLSVVHRTRFALEEGSLVHRQPERFGITSLWEKPTPRLFSFETERGMNREEVDQVFNAARPFLRSFSGHPSVVGDFKFREHCLITYATEDDRSEAGMADPQRR